MLIIKNITIYIIIQKSRVTVKHKNKFVYAISDYMPKPKCNI